MIDTNLLFDEERFVGAKNLVALIEAENGYSQSLEFCGKSKRPIARVSREGESNIGGLGEGTLHLVLKNYISANREEQEVRFEKKYIDVFVDGRAYEVQTRNFSALKSKLDVFLPHFPVTVVYPIVRNKKIAWLDPDTGVLSSFRKSPKKQSVYSIFSELVYLKDYLSRDNLSFCVFEVDTEEIKLLCGKRSRDRKKGSVRLNRTPTALHAVTLFDSYKDFTRLLPPQDCFTVKELAAFGGIDTAAASQCIYCLRHAGLLISEQRKEKEKEKGRGKGNEKIYRRVAFDSMKTITEEPK